MNIFFVIMTAVSAAISNDQAFIALDNEKDVKEKVGKCLKECAERFTNDKTSECKKKAADSATCNVNCLSTIANMDAKKDLVDGLKSGKICESMKCADVDCAEWYNEFDMVASKNIQMDEYATCKRECNAAQTQRGLDGEATDCKQEPMLWAGCLGGCNNIHNADNKKTLMLERKNFRDEKFCEMLQTKCNTIDCEEFYNQFNSGANRLMAISAFFFTLLFV